MSHSTRPAILALSLLLTACSGSDEPSPAAPATATTAVKLASSPEVVVERYIDAIQRGDEAAAYACMTPAAADAIASDDTLAMESADLELFELGLGEIDGERAVVPATLIEGGDERQITVLLREVDGAWLVYGLGMPVGDDFLEFDLERLDNLFEEVGQTFVEEIGQGLAEEMNKAFAEAQSAWEQGGTLDEIARARADFEALAAVSEAEHDAAWRVDVAAAGRPAREVLIELLAGTGLELDAGSVSAALAAEVDLTLAGVSRPEAIERLAQELDLHPLWPETTQLAWFGDETPTPALSFARGPRPLPAVFAGPFLVEVSELIENSPQPTGRLTLTVRGLGLAPAVLAFQTEMAEVLAVDQVRSAAGEALVDEDVQHLSTPSVQGGYFVYAFEQDLTGLLSSVESIETVTGAVRLSLPSRIEAVAWQRSDAEPRELEAGTLSLSDWGETVSFELNGPGAQDLRVLSSPRRADGSPLGTRFANAWGWGEQMEISLDCPEAPDTVDLKVCGTTEVRYPFSLPPIPLRDFAARPAQFETLSFEGPAPIAVELTGDLVFENGMADAPLRITNHCNKVVVSAQVLFVYLDAAGQELEDFTHSLTGEWDFESVATTPLAKAGATVDLTTNAAFAPEQTNRIRFVVQSAEFDDGTAWEAER
ncbi:hypothetical protein [Engelhardtia mirabilis]